MGVCVCVVHVLCGTRVLCLWYTVFVSVHVYVCVSGCVCVANSIIQFCTVVHEQKWMSPIVSLTQTHIKWKTVQTAPFIPYMWPSIAMC